MGTRWRWIQQHYELLTIIFRLSFKSNNSYTMALLKEISRMPLHSETFKHWEINYGQITPNHQPVCHIMIYRFNTRYYIELSGWYTGKTFWSASASASLLDLYFEVKAIADERTFRSLKDYERRGRLWHWTDKIAEYALFSTQKARLVDCTLRAFIVS